MQRNKVAARPEKRKYRRYMYMQETTSWQDAAALERYQMISPLLDPEMDNAKRIQLRQRIAD